MPRRPPSGRSQRAECPVADDPRGQQRRRSYVSERLGYLVGEGLLDEDLIGVPSLEVPSGETRIEAQVLVPRDAEAAAAAGVTEPRDADRAADGEARTAGAARVDDADHLVTGRDAASTRRKVALSEVKVRATHAAGAYWTRS